MMPQNNKFSEEEVRLILRSAVRGDRDAAVKLLQSYTNDMYFAARLYLKDTGMAKKTVQAAFNAAYTRLREAENEVSFENWLHGIVREYAVRAISPLHKEAPAAIYSSDDERATEGLDLPDEATCRKYLLQGFSVLTEEERMTAALRYYDHLTISRIASLLNATKEDTEVWLANAKASFERAGIIIGRILALIEKISGAAEMENTMVYSPRHASKNADFPEAPQETEETIENTSFRRFTDLSHEPLPEVPVKKEEAAENQEQDTIVLPRMPEMPAPAVSPESVPAEEKEEPVQENDSEEDDEDDEEGNPMVTNIIIGVSLAVLLAAGIFFLYQLKPELFSWLPFAKQTETVQTETESPEPSAAAQETSAPAETAAAAAEENTSLGTVSIEADKLNVRDSASMNGNPVSTVSKGEQYDVLETSFDGTQNWYRIGDGQWVTDGNAGYVTYTPAQ